MKRLLRVMTAAALAVLLCSPVQAEEKASAGAAASGAISSVGVPYDWRNGPSDITLLDQATLKLPAGYAWLPQDEARRMLQQFGNPNVADVVGVATGSTHDWLLVVRFDKSGMVRDKEAGKWNVDAVLESLRQLTTQTNLQRQKQSAPEIEILGWLEQPRYDAARHRLTWGIAVRNSGDESPDAQGLNYNTYLLGRDGYFSLNLITGLQRIDSTRPLSAALIDAIEFRDGKRYGDFSANDKAATFDIGGLLAGKGEVTTTQKAEKPAAAKKEGFFSTYGKLLMGVVIVILLLALGALGWLFWRQQKKSDEVTLTPEEPTMEEPAAGVEQA